MPLTYADMLERCQGEKDAQRILIGKLYRLLLELEWALKPLNPNFRSKCPVCGWFEPNHRDRCGLRNLLDRCERVLAAE